MTENKTGQEVSSGEMEDVLNEETCRRWLDTAWAGNYLEVYHEIDSTNRRAKQLGEEGAPHGALVAADSQTAGKGRRGRSWVTPAGSALAFSLLLRPSIPVDRVSMLTLVAALAVSRAIDELAGIRTGIKWPNDIVYERRKLCGILTEMSTDGTQIRYALVGIGVNVHMKEFPQELQDKALSLAMTGGPVPERARLLGRILHWFEIGYRQLEEDGDLHRMKQEYESRMAGRNDLVSIREGDQERIGTCLGITEMGAMRISFADGLDEEIIAGEVSVRGLYSYI
ncbi:MAG: biotin--[Lachnospiraceae bacterium]|nr:biotin--[acetyl-CoA-carboxylase] ligase [Lachnospiraceae bacterium]